MGLVVLEEFMISACSERMTERVVLSFARSAVLRSDCRRGRTVDSVDVEEKRRHIVRGATVRRVLLRSIGRKSDIVGEMKLAVLQGGILDTDARRRCLYM